LYIHMPSGGKYYPVSILLFFAKLGLDFSKQP
jgi:hypothetical protein